MILPFFTLNLLVATSQGIEEDYQNWLSGTPLAQLIEVNRFENQTLYLQVKPEYSTPESIKQIYASWDSLSRFYKKNEVPLSATLFNKLKQLANTKGQDLSINIASAIPALFSATIQMTDGELQEKIQFVDSKGIGDLPLEMNGVLFSSDFIPVKVSLQEAKKIVAKQTRLFLRKEFNLSKNEIREDKNGSSQQNYQVEKKGLLTKSYNDKIEVAIWYIPLEKEETEINFEFRAYYARGIISAGEYTEIDLIYLPELIQIQKKFKNYLNNL